MPNALLVYPEHPPYLLKPVGSNTLYLAIMSVRRQLSPQQVPAFTKFIAEVSRNHPRMLPEAIRLAALGFHFEKITRQQTAIHDFKAFLLAELEMFRETVSRSVQEVETAGPRRQEALARARARCKSIPDDFRYHGDGIEPALESFRIALNSPSDQLTHSAVL